MCLPNQSPFRRAQAIPSPEQIVYGSHLASSFPHGFAGLNSYGVPVPLETQKPKRRRKPQKPGFTAKNNERHFVQHNYHDHAYDRDETLAEEDSQEERRRGGVSVAFPLKLHSVLIQAEADGLGHAISWQPHGRCFVIHKPKEFTDFVMPRYWKQTKLTSFQRQLNLYGFSRLTRGPDAGGYYHELFLKGREFLCKRMTRTKVKGTKFKGASSPEQEPDFYQMPPVVSPHPSDEDFSHSNGSSTTLQLHQQQAVVSFSPTLPSSFAMPVNAVPPEPPQVNDRVLDEAVEELFFDELGSVADTLGDFLADWDVVPPAETTSGQPINDDLQLGFALEKLFE